MSASILAEAKPGVRSPVQQLDMLLLMSLSVFEQPQEAVPCGYVVLEFTPMFEVVYWEWTADSKKEATRHYVTWEAASAFIAEHQLDFMRVEYIEEPDYDPANDPDCEYAFAPCPF